jgi:hypothetical protein
METPPVLFPPGSAPRLPYLLFPPRSDFALEMDWIATQLAARKLGKPSREAPGGRIVAGMQLQHVQVLREVVSLGVGRVSRTIRFSAEYAASADLHFC